MVKFYRAFGATLARTPPWLHGASARRVLGRAKHLCGDGDGGLDCRMGVQFHLSISLFDVEAISALKELSLDSPLGITLFATENKNILHTSLFYVKFYTGPLNINLIV